jgi:O-acetyl-ADP-ribose deacetylase (regulator of RNase III)
MEARIDDATLELVQGDITEQDLDAIVNAANSGLRGGGGVDGAIHRAGGPEIMSECRKIGGCPTGEAVITTGGELHADHVIHAVGPRYRDGNSEEEEKLAGAYRRSLEVAREHDLRTVAFPSLSTGAYGYPIAEAARVALRTVMEYLQNNSQAFDLVRFVLFTESDYETYAAALTELRRQ